MADLRASSKAQTPAGGKLRQDEAEPGAWGKPPFWPSQPDGARGSEGLPTGALDVTGTGPATLPSGGFKPAGLARGNAPRPGDTDRSPGRGAGA